MLIIDFLNQLKEMPRPGRRRGKGGREVREGEGAHRRLRGGAPGGGGGGGHLGGGGGGGRGGRAGGGGGSGGGRGQGAGASGWVARSSAGRTRPGWSTRGRGR